MMGAEKPGTGTAHGTVGARQRGEAVRLLLQRAKLLDRAGQYRSASQARIDAQELRTGTRPPRPWRVENPPSRIDRLLQAIKPPTRAPRKAGNSMKATDKNATPKTAEETPPAKVPVHPVRQVQFREATAPAPEREPSRPSGQKAKPGDAPEPVREGTLNTEDLFRFPTNLH